MTLRLTVGIDPGISGALAVLRDGVLADAIDMPTQPRRPGGEQIDAAALTAYLRGLRSVHVGAHILAAIEQVGAMPGQGVTSMFRFGESAGVIRGVLGALGIPATWVPPQVWKRAHGILGAEKGYSRTVASNTWPMQAEMFRRVKDHGRADAALIALCAWRTGRHAEAA